MTFIVVPLAAHLLTMAALVSPTPRIVSTMLSSRGKQSRRPHACRSSCLCVSCSLRPWQQRLLAPRSAPRRSPFRWCSVACFTRFSRVLRPCWRSGGGRRRRPQASGDEIIPAGDCDEKDGVDFLSVLSSSSCAKRKKTHRCRRLVSALRRPTTPSLPTCERPRRRAVCCSCSLTLAVVNVALFFFLFPCIEGPFLR